MDRKFLEDMGLEKDAVNNILDENSADIGRAKKTVEELTTERDALREQLAQRDKDLESLKAAAGDAEQVKAQLTELKSKYEAETARFQRQLDERNYSDAARETILSKGVKFSSKAAERAFLADLRAKELKLDGGTLVGFDEFLAQQKENDPTAFAGEKPTPHFSQGGNPNGTPPMTRGGFLKLNYSDQLKFKADNPDIVKSFLKG